jgi:hypothetical protein
LERAVVRVEGGQESLSRAGEPLTDCVGRASRHRGKVGGREAVDVAEDDEDSIFCGEDSGKEVPNRDRLGRIGHVLTASGQPLERRPRTPGGTKRVERAISGDAEEPGLRVAHVDELGPLLECGEERLLEDIFGERPVADDLDEELAEPFLGRREERLESVAIAFLAHRFDSSRRHRYTLPHRRLL